MTHCMAEAKGLGGSPRDLLSRFYFEHCGLPQRPLLLQPYTHMTGTTDQNMQTCRLKFNFGCTNRTILRKKMLCSGKDAISKTDEFSEKFQTAFDPPPPHFREIMLRFSRQNCDKSAYVQYGGTVVYYMILFPMRCM